MSPAPKFNQLELEALILDAAAKCIEESSLLDFTMAAISKEAGVSMGSIYKHVQSKEDVLLALATQMVKKEYDVFSELMNLPMTTPERLISTLLINPNKLHFFSFGGHLKMLIGNDAILQRAGSTWLKILIDLNQSIETIFGNAMMSAWQNDEMLLSSSNRDRAIEKLNVSVWSLSVGFNQVTYERQAWNLNPDDSELPFPLASDHVLVDSACAIINSVPWVTPLDKTGIAKVCNLLKALGYR